MYVGATTAPPASRLDRATKDTVAPPSEPPETVKAMTVGSRSAVVLVRPAAKPREIPNPTASAIAVAVAFATNDVDPVPAATAALSPR